ncbi:MAG: VOC family protein [Pseudomonadota bacterium]|nr:VOC family protein [Pseudomonadota bacterium]
MELIEKRIGPDDDLAKLWGIEASEIMQQILIKTPGEETGRLHFVEIKNPDAAVREDARPFDLGAKNIDVNCNNLPEKIYNLNKAGYSFRSELAEYEIEDIRAREVQMPAHDGINISFNDILSPGFETNFTKKGFAALTSFVVIVKDIEREADFYRDIFGFTEIMKHKLTGPAIEKVIGLPEGSAVNMHLYGHPTNMFGRIELIHYEGLHGNNLFPKAEPPATGILYCGFEVKGIEKFIENLRFKGFEINGPFKRNTIIGSGLFMDIKSPSGLKLQIFESY